MRLIFASYTHQDEREEIAAYKKCLREYFESMDMACVIFERNWRSQHMQLQVVPVPSACIGRLEATFRSVGQRHGLKFDAHPHGTKVEEVGKLLPALAFCLCVA